IETFLGESNHEVIDRMVIPDEMAVIRQHILDGCRNPDVDVILTTGGTGISHRDVTIETVAAIIEKELTGFGELFRMLSYTEDIGSSAMLSRAIAGSHKQRAIFAMPGSSGAV